MQRFLDVILETPQVFDGAMGTMLYDKGVFINTCYDELCLSRGDLVREIHEAYVAAGADVIETNTFGANRIRLTEHGLTEQVAAINTRGVQLARAAAGESVFVAASVGPCLNARQLWSAAAEEPVRAAFAEQLTALVAAGVDLIFLETFVHLGELLVAAEVAAGRGVPVFASFTVNERRQTPVGHSLESVVQALDDCAGVDGVGINCSTGPAHAYEAAEQILSMTRKPLVVMPNAGMPREVEGRTLYLTSPEYFTKYAKRLIELGVRGIGGCCGTTPAHIRVAARAVKSLSKVKTHIEIRTVRPEEHAQVETVPSARKSRLARRMLRGEKVCSVEILPPRTFDLSTFLSKARQCYQAGVDAINIPDGPRASARVSPMIAAIAVQREVGIETILHYCCRDRNLIGMQSDLLGAYAAGLRNILIITGDPPKLGDYPDATGVFDVDAIGLTRVVANLNRGLDIGGNPVGAATGIFTGVGANPCAVSFDYEAGRYRTGGQPRHAACGGIHATRTSETRRSASPRPGAWSRRATCTSTSSPARPARRRRGRRQGGDLQHDHRFRRHLDGHRGHEVLAGLARGDRRLDRDGRRLRGLSTARRHRRLRQEHARLPDGDGAAEPSGGVRLRRHDPARAAIAARTVDIVSVFEAVGATRAAMWTTPSCTRSRLRDPGRRFLRRHVHRQHHGLGDRGAGA
jgi:methionine synthase / methylenetetrahydrofolate reductase(NADPH)